MKLLRDVAIQHLLTLEPHASLRQAAKSMSGRGVGSAVVMEQGDVGGIVTERDLLNALASDLDPDDVKVADIMTRDIVSGSPGWTILEAVRTMIDGGFRHLLVMEMDGPEGIVSLRDLMDSMAELIQEQDSSA
jgi:CBS domain-containing protein